MPKQLMPLLSGSSLLQETANRLAGLDDVAPPLVIANSDHRFMIAAQLQELGITATALVLEPVGRNTAAAAAVAAKIVGDLDPESILVLLPADHHIPDAEGFKQAVRQGAELAARGHIVTFGITPRSPETGYGYIKRGTALGDDAFTVAQFCEKPDLARADAFLCRRLLRLEQRHLHGPRRHTDGRDEGALPRHCGSVHERRRRKLPRHGLLASR
jgi:mannose-1-phosphate guanylyltransferase